MTPLGSLALASLLAEAWSGLMAGLALPPLSAWSMHADFHILGTDGGGHAACSARVIFAPHAGGFTGYPMST